MKIFLLILLIVHGIIHLLGFVKAFELARVDQLTQPISKTAGLFWLLATVWFFVTALLLMLNSHSWWIAALIAVLLSQFLIILGWADAKFGTIANVIVLVPIFISFMNSLPSSFQNRYEAEVQKRLRNDSDIPVLDEHRIQHLPILVQNYLRYVGAVGKPMVHNFRAVCRGSMKLSMDGNWLDITTQQYDYVNGPARFFYIESSLYGIPFDGLHLYVDDHATMQIKAASVFQVVDAKGDQMNQGETVTLFNDICVLAPSALVDTSIHWEAADSLTVKATYTNKAITITALLSFNEKGELTNFISNDRYLSADGKNYLRYPWSTPLKDYKDFDGRKIPTYAETIWHTPEGEYMYGKFEIVEIAYNCKEFK